MISLSVVAVGAVIGWRVPVVEPPHHSRVSGERIFQHTYDGLIDGSKRITVVTQSGSLLAYLAIVMTVVSVVLFAALFTDLGAGFDELVLADSVAVPATDAEGRAERVDRRHRPGQSTPRVCVDDGCTRHPHVRERGVERSARVRLTTGEGAHARLKHRLGALQSAELELRERALQCGGELAWDGGLDNELRPALSECRPRVRDGRVGRHRQDRCPRRKLSQGVERIGAIRVDHEQVN
jgi:hypothetical protein